jgi:hypothetical protein
MIYQHCHKEEGFEGAHYGGQCDGIYVVLHAANCHQLVLSFSNVLVIT